MRFKDIASRVTGLSCPIFGVSWNPPEAEIHTARRVIVFLEDRRVLYVPSEMETPGYCVQSILEIRSFLTEQLQGLSAKGELTDSLRALRASCRKFLDAVGRDDEIIRFAAQDGHWASWEFNGAVGELRGVFGIHIARIATSFGLDVEDDLAVILPGDVKLLAGC